MQRTSREYKNEQKQYLRNEQYVYVYLGVISREAQGSATAEGDFAPYSDEISLFGSPTFEAYYATAEENMATADGTQFFPPRDQSSFALYQGLVSENLGGTVTFRFGKYKHLDIKGLTIDFGDYYPTSFTVTNGQVGGTYTYTNNRHGTWGTEDEFLDTEYIALTVHSMVGGAQRLRIFSIKFGVGFVFDNNNLISTSWKSEVAHLSDALPSKSFTFTIDNLSRKFSADNPHSFVAFLEEQQEVNFNYGRKMNDGTIYMIPGGKMFLESWSSNDQQAKFTAVSTLDYSTGEYIKGQYYPDGISLYDLAVEVCEDAGYEEYSIDTYLKKLITHNPLPIESHKNLLQLIANASMAILRETRQGKIELKTSFEPDVIDISSSSEMSYSKHGTILDASILNSEYASAEKDFSCVDAHQYFLPRNITSAGQYDTGFISSAITRSNGYFNSNPWVQVTWEAGYTFIGVTLVFSDAYPTAIRVLTYKDSELVEQFTVDEDIDLQTQIDHDFYDIDSIRFEFTQGSPYQRVHLGKIQFGKSTDYTLSYTDMSASPTSLKTEFVRDVNVVYTEFDYGEEVKSISTVTTVEGENLFTSKTAHHDYSLAYKELKDDDETYKKVSKVFVDALPNVDDAKTSTRYFVRNGNGYQMYVVKTTDNVKGWDDLGTVTETIVSSLPSSLSNNVLYLVRTDTNLIYHLYMLDDGETKSFGYDVRGTLTILESGAYYLKFTTNVVSPVTISGIEFLISEQTYTSRIHEIGVDKTATNVLVDDLDHAIKESEWLTEYYANDVEYTITYRGEPALDPDDFIYTENKFVSKNLVRITDTQIDTSTGMSMNCVIHGRRVSYVDAPRVDYAIVDVSEVFE